jgi:hypothetical protein
MLLPILIGFAGIGIEVGLWFAIQRQNQSAADAAAISAGLEYAVQYEQPGMTTDPAGAATAAARYNLFSNPNCSTSGTTNCTLYPCYDFNVGSSSSCNTSNPNGTLPSAVQVALTQPLNTAFANFVTAVWGPNISTINVTTTAIAAFPPTATACFLALDPMAANAVSVNTGTLQNPNCWVAANSSSGSALNCNNCTITGPTTVVGGDAVSNNGQLNGSPNRTYASAIADPYVSKLNHTFLTSGMPPTCVPWTGVLPIAPNCYDQMWFGAGPVVDLTPGVYYVTNGNFSVASGAAVTCTTCNGAKGVTVILTTRNPNGGTVGNVQIANGSSVTLQAPNSGTFSGLLFIQDPLATSAGGANPDTAFNGGLGMNLTGLLYFPSTSLSFVGNVKTCLVAVANRLSLTGNISLNDSGCKSVGLTTVPTILSVFLADSHG